MIKHLLAKQTKTISVGGGKLTLRALTLQDLAQLQASHSDALSGILSGAGAGELLSRWPTACAAIIALSAGEPDGAADAATLPVGVQVAALDAVWELSEIDPEALGKLAGRVMKAMHAMTTMMPQPKP